jgi:hypothetical protein
MKPACEIIVQYVLPAIRALIGRDLIERYGLTQREAAAKLGMTQPAISQYKQELRGARTKLLEHDPAISKRIDAIVKEIARGELGLHEITQRFCSICREFRKKGMLCHLHRTNNPVIRECTICLER